MEFISDVVGEQDDRLKPIFGFLVFKSIALPLAYGLSSRTLRMRLLSSVGMQAANIGKAVCPRQADIQRIEWATSPAHTSISFQVSLSVGIETKTTGGKCRGIRLGAFIFAIGPMRGEEEAEHEVADMRTLAAWLTQVV
jgi:hypothetical protein